MLRGCSFFPRGGSLARRVLIGCVDVYGYIRATLCAGEFSTIAPSRDFCSGSNGVIENEMRVLEMRFIFINSLLLSTLAKSGASNRLLIKSSRCWSWSSSQMWRWW